LFFDVIETVLYVNTNSLIIKSDSIIGDEMIFFGYKKQLTYGCQLIMKLQRNMMSNNNGITKIC